MTLIPNPDLIREVTEQVDLDEAAEAVLEAARRRVPVGETGALRDSLHIEDTPGGGKRVVADTEYAAFVEFGTSLMAAEPYLRPAVDEAGLHR